MRPEARKIILDLKASDVAVKEIVHEYGPNPGDGADEDEFIPGPGMESRPSSSWAPR